MRPWTGIMNWLLGGLLFVSLSPAAAPAQGTSWDLYMGAAAKEYSQGRLEDAEMSLKDALREAEAFGAEDPRLAVTLNNLGLLYEVQKKYAEAEPLLQRALAIREKSLGPEHLDVAKSLSNLGAIYRAQGRYPEAEPLLRRALTIGEKVLGPEHPDLAISLENYAGLLRRLGRDGEASGLEARAKAIRAKHGLENPTK